MLLDEEGIVVTQKSDIIKVNCTHLWDSWLN